MNIALWISQVLLAFVFAGAAAMNFTSSMKDLAEFLPFATDYPWLVRLIGISELAGAVGLIAPMATRIQPRLTPLAAACLALVMLFAGAFHISRQEYTDLILVGLLFGLCCFVAVGRKNAS